MAILFRKQKVLSHQTMAGFPLFFSDKAMSFTGKNHQVHQLNGAFAGDVPQVCSDQVASGKHTKNDGKSPCGPWVNQLFRLGHVQ
jgi:hypothetical protein